jgi:arylsulfatase A-like enzyme
MRHQRISGAVTPVLLGAALLFGGSATAQAACGLKSADNKIKHVVHIQFDNVHLRRDNPNVPSDLEQMPNLLNFLQSNGTVSGNHHTPLISHTATDILTVLTGAYGDRMGVPVSNSYGFFRNDGSVSFSSSFLYWTALAGDGKPELLNENGKVFPAPWAPFTRAGCDVGAYSIANMEFESVPGDVRTVFGTGSPEDIAVTAALNLPRTPANAAARQAPSSDYLGIAVHCALGSPLCNNSHARTDALPDEPGGYTGFSALFGSVNVAPVLCAAAPAGCNGSGAVKDTDGGVIADAYGRPGFPNVFSPLAKQSLGYAATMLEAGIPVVYVYVADAHDRNPLPLDPVTNLPGAAHAFGAGEAEYLAQLNAYDVAFGKFFARLAADGINKDNTLFVVTADENDHFVGGPASPGNCDGIHVPCTYAQIGEIDTFLDRLLLTQRNNTTPFDIHFDDAPTFYIHGNPGPQDPLTRTMEHDIDALQVTNPITNRVEKLNALLADRAEMTLLHMITSNPARSPSFTMFGNPDYFNETSSASTGLGHDCSQTPACVFEAPGFAWNHGDVQKQITRTWLGMVGPGVVHAGRNDQVFSDHTDLRPTMIALAGLKDDYTHDGRVLIEFLDDHALPKSLRRSENFLELAQVYKQLNAPLGSVGLDSLRLANRSILGDDAGYAKFLATIADITTQRDALAAEIKPLLEAAAFDNQPINERQEDQLVRRARVIIDRAADLAHDDHDHDHDHDRGRDHH